MKFLMAILALFGLVAAAPALAETAFAPGQIWTLKSDAFPGALVEIGKTESLGGHPIVHVTVLNVPVINAAGQPDTTTLGHLPFDEAALRKSVGELVKTGAPPYPRFEEGYDTWKSANGGVFTISLPEVIKICLGMIPPKPAEQPATGQSTT